MTAQDILSRPDHYRLRVSDYELLDRSGAFRDFAKTELIEGVIVAMNAQFSRHIRVQSLLYRALADACDRADAGVQAWVEGSIALANESMPQPDILVTRGLPERGPVPTELVALIAEVSDTTLEFDLNAKALLYSQAGIPEYWVADVESRVLHQFWTAGGAGYQHHESIAFGETATSRTIGSLRVATTTL